MTKAVVATLKNDTGKSMSEWIRENKPEVLSRNEKEMLAMVMPECEELAYPIVDRESSVGTVERVYDIPESDRFAMIDKCFPFAPMFGADEEVFDIHERKTFTFRDAQIVRCDRRNMVVSPYYLQSGGMACDIIKSGNDDCTVMALRDGFGFGGAR